MKAYMICIEGSGFAEEWNAGEEDFTLAGSPARARTSADVLYMAAAANRLSKRRRTKAHVLRMMLAPSDWSGAEAFCPCVWHLDGLGFFAQFLPTGRLGFSDSISDALEYRAIENLAKAQRLVSGICAYDPRMQSRISGFRLLKIVATLDERHFREDLA